MSYLTMNQGPSELPVLETRKVLMNHLYAKVWPLCESSSFANDITSRIAKNLGNKEIISLLENDVALTEAVNSLLSKTDVGERLFVAVAKIDSGLCAQITGMLLELDESTLETLLASPNTLQGAVQQAKSEYLKYTQKVSKDEPTCKGRQEDLGEVVYNLVLEHHPDPDLAARLTGMLLELESCHLQSLVQDPRELKLKLDLACKVLCKS